MVAPDPMAVVTRHQATAPVNLDAIARDLGIRVYSQPLGSNVAGKLVRANDSNGRAAFSIYVNATDHPNRRRFTQAHEIAHFILHRDLIERGLVDDVMYRSDLSGAYETQANRLAADILMPIPLMRKMWERIPSAGGMARIFGVSEEAMRIRLDSISLNQLSLF